MSVTVVPDLVSSTGGTNTTFGASPYVDTQDGDASWVQTDPAPSSGGTWRLRLPATETCSDPSSITLRLQSRFVEGTGGTGDPADDASAPAAYLARSLDGGSSFFVATLSQSVGTHNSYAYNIEDRIQEPNSGFGITLADIAGMLADGNLWITVVDQYHPSDKHAFRVTYAAVTVECPGTPPLRQNQRDDLRQNQRTSRQLTVRQRGYL